MSSLTLVSIVTYKEGDSQRPQKKFFKNILELKTFDTINKE